MPTPTPIGAVALTVGNQRNIGLLPTQPPTNPAQAPTLLQVDSNGNPNTSLTVTYNGPSIQNGQTATVTVAAPVGTTPAVYFLGIQESGVFVEIDVTIGASPNAWTWDLTNVSPQVQIPTTA
jgi:hypothetical protein